MALSVIVYPGNGTQRQFAIPFSLGYLREQDVACRVGNEVDGAGNPLYRSLTFISPELVEVSGAAAPVGSVVRFTRTVDRTQLLVDYEDGAIINEENMNTAQKQAIMLVQEVMDGRFDALQTDFDMNNLYTLRNLPDPVLAQDAVNKRYVDARIQLNTANVTAAQQFALAAQQARDAAAGSASRAANAAAASEAARDQSNINSLVSYQWANNPEDVPVESGAVDGYSAFHWAKKAEIAAGGGVMTWAGLGGYISIEQINATIGVANFATTLLDNVTQDTVRQRAGTGTMAYRNLTISTSGPDNSVGVDGDVWYQIE